jgi:HK97 family phage major capsid protein/HK97 family phage prohead protease
MDRQALNKMLAISGAYLTRSITPEQINTRDGGVFRTAEVTRVMDEEKRTVELAFSSEAEVERWFGMEVLSHATGAMRTERLENGAAVLLNHDWDDQVGVVESIEIGADRRGRAVVRFGKGTRASEVFQDVLDGIRRHVSVGYRVHRVEIEERSGMADLVTVTDWEPYEISLVSVPADPTVGVGRSMENAPEDEGQRSGNTDDNSGNPDKQEPADMNEKILRDAQGNLVRALVDEDGNITKVLETLEKAGEGERAAQRTGSETERNRVRSIMEMAEQYGAEDLARDAVKGNTSVADFQRQLLDHLNAERSKPLGDETGADIGMSDNEVRQFSFIRALRALANPTDKRAQEAAAFEYEASRAAAERAGKEPEGILVPADVLRRALNSTATGTAAGDTGGYSISTDLMSQSFVEMLRNRAVLMQLGTTMGGLVGNIAIPRQSAGATGYWIGEDEDATEDGLELDQIGMTPKTVAALSEVTRKLLMQSSLDVEALIRRDLASALALTIDKAGFYGTGSGNQPLGIANATGINAVDFAGATSGATGALPTYAEVVKMESEIAADNADVNSMAYVMNSGMRGHFKTTQKFSGTDGSPIWEPGNTVNGYGTQVTNQIQAGDMFFGNFADLLIGMWGGLDLTVDPYTHSAKGRVRVVAMQDVDFVLRRVESFCLGRDAT